MAFLALVEEGFYVGLVFHRVIPNFMIQAGGYDAELNYRPRDGQVDNESFNGLRNKRYTVAMARLSDPDSADTQFFINVRDNPHLDAQPGEPGYTVFGRVVSGMDVIETIELTDTHLRMGMAAVPENSYCDSGDGSNYMPSDCSVTLLHLRFSHHLWWDCVTIPFFI